jgi:hypothetical protein
LAGVCYRVSTRGQTDGRECSEPRTCMVKLPEKGMRSGCHLSNSVCVPHDSNAIRALRAPGQAPRYIHLGERGAMGVSWSVSRMVHDSGTFAPLTFSSHSQRLSSTQMCVLLPTLLRSAKVASGHDTRHTHEFPQQSPVTVWYRDRWRKLGWANHFWLTD